MLKFVLVRAATTACLAMSMSMPVSTNSACSSSKDPTKIGLISHAVHRREPKKDVDHLSSTVQVSRRGLHRPDRCRLRTATGRTRAGAATGRRSSRSQVGSGISVNMCGFNCSQRRWERLANGASWTADGCHTCANPPRVRGLAQYAEVCSLYNVRYRGLKAERFGRLLYRDGCGTWESSDN